MSIDGAARGDQRDDRAAGGRPWVKRREACPAGGSLDVKAVVAQPSTSDRILDFAERLVQTRGFNGFSYADVAEHLGVTKASLHYHFPTKADLGLHLIQRYAQAFQATLSRIDATDTSAGAKLRAYVDIYAGVLMDDRMCLCGMLAADHTTLPASMRAAVTHFFELNEEWLAAVLAQGRAASQLSFSGEPGDVARLLIGSLEGGMLVARSFGETARFQAISDRLLADLVRADQPQDQAALAG
jgi:TetR/AcrR family transcriptional repressor of nem operon